METAPQEQQQQSTPDAPTAAAIQQQQQHLIGPNTLSSQQQSQQAAVGMTAPRELAQQLATGAEEAAGSGGIATSNGVMPLPLPALLPEQQAADKAAAAGAASGNHSEAATGNGLLPKNGDAGASAASVLLADGSPQTGLLAVSSSTTSLHSGNGVASAGPGSTAGAATVAPSAVTAAVQANGELLQSGASSVAGSIGGSEGINAGNKTLYLGNLHPFVTEQTLQELFSGLGGITELKVIKDKATGVSAGYGFAKFADTTSATLALEKVNKATVFGQEVRVNWAFQKEQKEDSSQAVHVFVGDLSSDVSDAMLHAAFQGCLGICDARVMWDHATGRSRGYGFVSFRTREDAEAAIAAMHGQFIGARRVRCGWAQHKTDNVVPMDPPLLDKADPTNTNVYVGNLAPDLTDAEVRRQFGAFGPIAEVKLYRKGSYGFVRFKSHDDAVKAIVGMNGQALSSKVLKCSWGRHPGMPPSGVQTSLMLAAAAGLGPMALGAGGMLNHGAGMGVPGLHLGHMMAAHPGGMMAGLGMPMAGAASQGLLHPGAAVGAHLAHAGHVGAGMMGGLGMGGLGAAAASMGGRDQGGSGLDSAAAAAAAANGLVGHMGGPGGHVGGVGSHANHMGLDAFAGHAAYGLNMGAGLPHPYGGNPAGMYGFGIQHGQ